MFERFKPATILAVVTAAVIICHAAASADVPDGESKPVRDPKITSVLVLKALPEHNPAFSATGAAEIPDAESPRTPREIIYSTCDTAEAYSAPAPAPDGNLDDGMDFDEIRKLAKRSGARFVYINARAAGLSEVIYDAMKNKVVFRSKQDILVQQYMANYAELQDDDSFKKAAVDDLLKRINLQNQTYRSKAYYDCLNYSTQIKAPRYIPPSGGTCKSTCTTTPFYHCDVQCPGPTFEGPTYFGEDLTASSRCSFILNDTPIGSSANIPAYSPRMFFPDPEVLISRLQSPSFGNDCGNINYMPIKDVINGFKFAPEPATSTLLVSAPESPGAVDLYEYFEYSDDFYPDDNFASVGAIQNLEPECRDITAGDFDGDYVDEIIISSSSPENGGQITALKMNNGQFDTEAPLAEMGNVLDGGGGAHIAAGDFDGDGYDELAISSAERSMIKIFKLGGEGFDTETPLAEIGQFFGDEYEGGAYVAAGDFDGDGYYELAASKSAGSAEVVVLKFDGGAASETVRLDAIFDGEENGAYIAAGDLDGDMRDELAVSRASGIADIKAFTMKDSALVPFAQVQPGMLGDEFTTGARISSGDFDGDGRGEIAAATTEGPAIVTVIGYSAGKFKSSAWKIKDSFTESKTGALIAAGKL